MQTIEIKAHAKINLSLDVLSRRADGYHELKMIMQSIELHDVVSLERAASGIMIDCDNHRIPDDGRNTAFKAAALIMEKYGIRTGVKIRIRKRIPVAAGLAGGSADAAAVLRGLNDMFSLGAGTDELKKLGKAVGADVPFCVEGGTMLAEGIGDILTALEPFRGVHLVLIKPKIGVSTAWVYKNLDLSAIQDRPDTELLLKALKKGNILTVAAQMRNVLETVTIPAYPVVYAAKDRLLKLGALGSMMSGSGPSVFGIFPDGESAARACGKALDSRWDCWTTVTI